MSDCLFKCLLYSFVGRHSALKNKRRLKFLTSTEIVYVVPENYEVMGAIGGAILARQEIERKSEETSFKGFDYLNLDFRPSSFICNGCSNSCEST